VPLLEPSYEPPWGLKNEHAQTVLARFLRRVAQPGYERRRLTLTDGDFLDLDEISRGNNRVAILLHGLESSTEAPYMRGMALCLLEEEWDITAMNFRGCSGEPNDSLRSYHSGVTEDLQEVIDDVRRRRPDVPIALVGFSLGGNVTLRYLGEQGEAARDQGIVVAAGISVPCHLESCSDKFAQSANRHYMKRFLRSLFHKVRHKQETYPDALDYEAILASRNFHDFDEHFTAKVHGFESAMDYWTKCSSDALAHRIAVPILLVNALDDPFLTDACHLQAEAKEHAHLYADLPKHGGHVGFIGFGAGCFYQERRVREFFGSTL
jgi:predicted alpha/beta-fold hydrolase